MKGQSGRCLIMPDLTQRSIIQIHLFMQNFEEIEPLAQFLPHFHQIQGQPPTATHIPTSTLVCILTRPSSPLTQPHLDCYRWRYETEYPVVKIFRLQQPLGLDICSELNVFVQKFQFLLSELSHIELPYLIYIFRTILAAARQLLPRFGAFLISARMVGITCKDECKVWVNSDLTKNVCESPCQTQKEMLLSALEVLRKIGRTNDRVLQDFLQQGREECQNILRGQNFITKFCFENQIIIPPFFQPQSKILQTITLHRKTNTENLHSLPTKRSNYDSSSSFTHKYKPRVQTHDFNLLSVPFRKSERYDQGLNGTSQASSYLFRATLTPSGRRNQSFKSELCETKESSRKASGMMEEREARYSCESSCNMDRMRQMVQNRIKVKGSHRQSDKWKWSVYDKDMGNLSKTSISHISRGSIHNVPHSIADSIIEEQSESLLQDR